MSLTRCVYEIVQQNPKGMRHSEVVREVLRLAEEKKVAVKNDLSATIHQILMGLVNVGAISRREERMTRTYAGKKFISCQTTLRLRQVMGKKDVYDYADSCPDDCPHREHCPELVA